MLYVVVGHTKDFRKKEIKKIYDAFSSDPVYSIFFDDTHGDILLLKDFLYPSLFEDSLPVVHTKYILSVSTLGKKDAQVFHESPTLFILEEIALSSEHKKTLQGVVGEKLIIENHPIKKDKKEFDAFALINALKKGDRKELWLTYRSLVGRESPEALMGILLWGIRKASLEGPKKEMYKKMYSTIMGAYSRARLHNIPLEYLLEKTLLEQ